MEPRMSLCAPGAAYYGPTCRHQQRAVLRAWCIPAQCNAGADWANSEGLSLLTAIQRAAAAFLMTAILAFSAQAQSGARELHVATRILPPLVSDQHGKLTGFSIELWDKIAERLDVKTIYEVAPDIDHLLEEVRSRKAQVGISAISITSAREAEFDFSQPMLNGGLQIMVRGKAKDDLLEELFNLLFSRAILVWLGIALLLILIPAHLVWLFERRHKNGIVPSENYIPVSSTRCSGRRGRWRRRRTKCLATGLLGWSRCSGCSRRWSRFIPHSLRPI